jgi:hypothetical protein
VYHLDGSSWFWLPFMIVFWILLLGAVLSVFDRRLPQRARRGRNRELSAAELRRRRDQLERLIAAREEVERRELGETARGIRGRG